MVVREFRNALRNLARNRRFSLTVILTLALAVGGTGSLLSLFHALVLRQLPVRDAGRLVAVYPANGEALLGIPINTLADLQNRQTVFDGLCGYSRGALEVEIGASVTTHAMEAYSEQCYAMLGVRPIRGRLIARADAPTGTEASPVVVVSSGFWVRALGGRPEAVGQILRVQGVPLTIIGVTEPRFRGLNAEEAPDITVPLALVQKLVGGGRPLALYAIGRLLPNQTLVSASVQIRQVWPEVWATSNPNSRSPAGSVTSLRVESLSRGISTTLRGRYERPLAVLLALALVLLALTAVNVGGLFLARTVLRGDELRVRIALGGSRASLFMQVLSEGLILSIAAALPALLISWWSSHLLAQTIWTSSRPLTMDVSPSGTTIAAIATVTLVTGFVTSLAPILFVRRTNWQSTPVTGGRAGSAPTLRWQRLFLVVQVATSLVLVFCASIFVRNLVSIQSLDPGYSTAGLRWGALELPFGKATQIDHAAYFQATLGRVSALPQVERVALALSFPTTQIAHVRGLSTFARVDRDTAEIGARTDWVSQDFFRTVEIPLLRGREFTWMDNQRAPQVAVVNAAFALRAFGADEQPVGQRIRAVARNEVLAVVGVVANASPGDARIRALPIVYRPLLQNPVFLNAPILVVRAKSDVGLADAVRAAVGRGGRHRLSELKTIQQQMNRFLTPERIVSSLSLAFGFLGTLVSAIGLFGLLSYTTARRCREFGLRLALGATRPRLISPVVREALVMTLTGTTVGAPVALLVRELARSVLYQPASFEWVSLFFATVLLLAVSAAAAARPAYRVTRIDPARALRDQ